MQAQHNHHNDDQVSGIDASHADKNWGRHGQHDAEVGDQAQESADETNEIKKWQIQNPNAMVLAVPRKRPISRLPTIKLRIIAEIKPRVMYAVFRFSRENSITVAERT